MIESKNWGLGSCYLNGLLADLPSLGVRSLYEQLDLANEGVREMVARGEIKEGRKSVLSKVLKKAEREGMGRRRYDSWEVEATVEEDGEGGWAVGEDVRGVFNEWKEGKGVGEVKVRRRFLVQPERGTTFYEAFQSHAPNRAPALLTYAVRAWNQGYIQRLLSGSQGSARGIGKRRPGRRRGL